MHKGWLRSLIECLVVLWFEVEEQMWYCKLQLFEVVCTIDVVANSGILLHA